MVEAESLAVDDMCSDIYWRLHAVVVACMKVRRAVAIRNDWSVTELTALSTIELAMRDGRPIGATELANRVGFTPANATRLLDRLERRGDIRRARAGADRRRVTLTVAADTMAKLREDPFSGAGMRSLIERAALVNSADGEVIMRLLDEIMDGIRLIEGTRT